MGLLDMAINGLTSLTGYAPRAVLAVRRISPQTKIGIGDAVGRFEAAAGGLNSLTASMTAASAMDMLSISTSANPVWFTDFSKHDTSNRFHYMEVQYNPSTIKFNTQAGAYQSSQGAGEAGINQITQMTIKPQTNMTVDLIFDAVNIKDAFMEEKLKFSVGGVAGMIMAAIKTYSVEPIVDGLFSLSTQVATRQLVFHWGHMCFAGELENINATYSMFSPSGQPIRATVSLSIRQKYYNEITGEKDSNGNPVTVVSEYEYWERAFNEIFGPPGTVSLQINAKSGLQSVSNMLNMNL